MMVKCSHILKFGIIDFFSEATTTSKNYPTGYIGMIEQMMR